MSRKRKEPEIEVPNPLVVDEAEFTDVIRKMVNTEPVTREEVEKHGQQRRGIERRKNPETDPRYLPVFDFSQRLTPEQIADVEQQRKRLAEYERKYNKKKR